jgi:hypothetical protein
LDSFIVSLLGSFGCGISDKVNGGNIGFCSAARRKDE